MALTFADTHNMIAYLTKSDASEGFDQIIDFLNVNDVTRLQALVDKKKLIITKAIIWDALRLYDVESIDCLPNKEIFTELSRMGVNTFKDTVMDDVSKQGRIIANVDADEDVTLKDVDDIAKEVVVDAEIEESADVQGRQAESQAQIYQIGLDHADKVLSMQHDEVEPAEHQEVYTARRRKGVVIKDPEETATPSIIIHFEPKSKDKDKGKGILVEEPKPLKKQAQIEQDEAYARELEKELNKNINWDDVIDQVQRKEKQDNVVMRYQALKRKPQTEAQARKNMMIYLRNMAGFKMDYFKGMSYDDIHLIFEKYFNSNVAFLEKTKEQIEEEDSRALKRANESQAVKGTKKQKLDEEVVELKKHLQIVKNNEDDIYTKATPLARKKLKKKVKFPWNCSDFKATTARRIQTRIVFEYILHKDQAS
nr:hypothetical protein [Tanacetum cinerariifolium]